MQILVIGSGGREHALVWKIAQSQKVSKVWAAPGNAGIGELAECVNINASDIRLLADLAERKRIDLTIVGPEVPLTLGIVDEFERPASACSVRAMMQPSSRAAKSSQKPL